MTISLQHLTGTSLTLFISVFSLLGKLLSVHDCFVFFFCFSFVWLCRKSQFEKAGSFFHHVLFCCMPSGDNYGPCSSTFRHAMGLLFLNQLSVCLTGCVSCF